MDFETVYHSGYEKRISDRYITLDTLLPLLKEYSCIEDFSVIGNSENNRDIYGLKLGSGPFKILIWSQMHGNESTTTKALVDLLSVLDKNEELKAFVFQKYTLFIIPVLNPDGAVVYTRENANKVDLNRDAKLKSQSESRVLWHVFNEFQPHLCLNMHDQRTIFSAGNTGKPATVSFLAPAADKKKSLSENRKTAMELIAVMREALEIRIPGQIGRYDDTFNANCFGDSFQAAGIPIILFEAGHFPGDYARDETRKYIFYALLALLQNIDNPSIKRNYRDYFDIPENQKAFRDVIIHNASFKELTGVVDVVIQYEEKPDNGKIYFVPKIESIGNFKHLSAHKSIDAKGEKVAFSQGISLKEGSVITTLQLGAKKIDL